MRALAVAKREMAATGAIVLGLLVAVGWLGRTHGELAPGQCQPVLDRYVDLRLRASYDKVTSSLLDETEDRNHRNDRLPEALGDCARHLTKEGADCAMNAPSADELERCFP